MKVVMLWRYYPAQYEYFYSKYPQALTLSYSQHRNLFFSEHFGWPSELAQLMNTIGIQTEFLVINDEILQYKWAVENGLVIGSKDNWEQEIVLAQIKSIRPNVVWISSLDLCGAFAYQLKHYCDKIILWVGSPFVKTADVGGASVLITENPATLQAIHHVFERVIVTKPGFDEQLLPMLQNVKKEYDVSFVGTLSPAHQSRVDTLSYLHQKGVMVDAFANRQFPKKPSFSNLIRGMASFLLKEKSITKASVVLQKWLDNNHKARRAQILETFCKPPLFGLEMYRVLAASSITLNIHIDCAQGNVGNMRLFESTGVGACVITEHGANIAELFEPDKEIITYKSKEEMVEKITYLLEHRALASEIGLAGQQRTLRDHSVARMLHDIMPAFS